jgi:antibiotic biosynthesis monooxygenase (ABM) superfamily enzyme
MNTNAISDRSLELRSRARQSVSVPDNGRVIDHNSKWEFDDNLSEAELLPSQPEAPVTVTFRKRVAQSHADEFLAWQRGIVAAMRSFEARRGSGHIASTLLREPLDSGDELFVLVATFQHVASAKAWNTCQERKEWLERLAQLEREKGLTQLGISMSFSPMPIFSSQSTSTTHEGDGRRGLCGAATRGRLMMWLVIWLQVFAWVEASNALLPACLGSRWIGLNFHLQLFISTWLVVGWIEFVSNRIVLGFLRRVGWLG